MLLNGSNGLTEEYGRHLLHVWQRILIVNAQPHNIPDNPVIHWSRVWLYYSPSGAIRLWNTG